MCRYVATYGGQRQSPQLTELCFHACPAGMSIERGTADCLCLVKLLQGCFVISFVDCLEIDTLAAIIFSYDVLL